MPAEILLGISGLNQSEVIAIARGNTKITITEEALNAIRSSRAIIDTFADSQTPVYGVSTGFGALARKFIDGIKKLVSLAVVIIWRIKLTCTR